MKIKVARRSTELPITAFYTFRRQFSPLPYDLFAAVVMMD
jgi:hypothetical protein